MAALLLAAYLLTLLIPHGRPGLDAAPLSPAPASVDSAALPGEPGPLPSASASPAEQKPFTDTPATALAQNPPASPSGLSSAPDPFQLSSGAASTDEDFAPYRGAIRGARDLRLHFRLQRILHCVNETAFRLDPVLAGGLDPAWSPLIGRLETDGFDRTATERIFARLGPGSYTPAYMGLKVTELHGVPGIGVRRSQRATPQVPARYSPPVPDNTIRSCLDFMRQYADVLADIKTRHGVSADTVLSILLVETAFGINLGNDVALRALASMAATNTPERLSLAGNGGQAQRVRPASLAATLRDKSRWAYNEVKALLRHTSAAGLDPCTLPGSFYGAIGLCQFMPSNIEIFGVDGDQDGSVNLFSVVDAMYSVANYLEANGWRSAGSAERKHAVIRTYNNDSFYASTVLGVSKRLDLALRGKVSPKSNAIAVAGFVPSARLDPSLRRLRPPPPRARIKSLGDYQNLLQ